MTTPIIEKLPPRHHNVVSPTATDEGADLDIRHDMSENEASIFHALLHPDDLYTESGTYWADLPLGQRIKFIAKVDAQEAKEEAAFFWNMFKEDPLAPVGHYFRNCVIPGAGLGLEG